MASYKVGDCAAAFDHIRKGRVRRQFLEKEVDLVRCARPPDDVRELGHEKLARLLAVAGRVRDNSHTTCGAARELAQLGSLYVLEELARLAVFAGVDSVDKPRPARRRGPRC